MIPSIAHCEKQPSLNALRDLKWKNRVLLIHQPQDDTETLKKLKAAKQKIDERHMVWFVTNKTDTASNYAGNISGKLAAQITKEHFADKNVFAVLIGKDGGVKAKYKKLDLAKVFALIDTMPMRQREMSSKRE